MELIVLGAGPAYTDRVGALGAAYLLTDGDEALLVDLGQGSFPPLVRAWEPARLSGIVISHLHPDHFVDLVALRHYLRYELTPRRRVRVLGPAGLGHRIDALHDEPGFSAEALDIDRLAVGTNHVGAFRVEAALVTHTSESYAFRIEPSGGHAPGLIYSGDCGNADDLRKLIRSGDTLLSEVSFGAGPVPPGAAHLDGPAVGILAAQARVSRLLLTHLQMGYDPDRTIESVRAHFAGEVAFVWPGDRVHVA